MDTANLIQELFKVAPVVGVLGWWIYSLKADLKDTKEKYEGLLKSEKDENTELIRDYKSMAEKAIQIITLTEDKLRKTEASNKNVEEIHRIVNELNTLIKNHLIK
jgi:hypothetical protein